MSGAGSTLTVNVALTFNASFAGQKSIFMNAQNSFGLWSNAESEGSWTVPSLGPPTSISVLPNSNSSPTPSQMFTFQSRSPNGTDRLGWFNRHLRSDTLRELA